jgi:cardiolipin synthase (CMP-forming)
MHKNINAANLITGSRLVFFFLFVRAAYAQDIEWVVFWFILSWGLDAVDGWVARRLKQTTHLGYLLDKAVDRMVLFIGLMILLTNRLIPDYSILILVKDISSLPAASAQVFSSKVMPSMGSAGKAVSVLQGIAIVWVLLGAPLAFFVVLAVAILGGLVGGTYLHRVYYGEDRI